MYYSYLKERHDVKLLKNKIRVDYEKIKIFKIIKTFNSGLPLPEEKKVSDLIFNLGEKYKINPALILAVIRVESSFNNFSYSNMGAVGLMQIKPVTGLYIIKKYRIKSKKFNYNTRYIEYLPINYLYNPSLNIKIGARYLLSLLYEFKNLKLAFVCI
jgi:Soluble lytic murein transglycosylase and related regulatory proteins (some contain LysM/invasin domains)